MIGGTVVVMLSSVSVIVMAIACICGFSTLSLEVNIGIKEIQLYEIIQYLNKRKEKLDYVISCNGD